MNRAVAPTSLTGWLTSTTFAHRGLHGPGVPENSLAAARAAMARGLGIECDIQRSLDGHPMVFHDWELARLTGHEGLTEDLLADELEALCLLGTRETPIRLARLLEEVGGKVPLLIEIKSRPDYDVEWTCVCVARLPADYRGACAVMSFDPRVPAWFARHAPDVSRGLVGTDSLPNGFEGVWRSSKQLALARPQFLAVDRRDLARPEAAHWRAQGHPLLSWTIRTSAQRDAAGLLADALIAEGEALA